MKISARGFSFSVPDYNERESHLGDLEADLPLSPEECQEEFELETKPTTRLVLRASEFPDQSGNYGGRNLNAYICHSRRSPSDQESDWQDLPHFKLSRLHAGEYAKVPLGPDNLQRLFGAMCQLYHRLGGLTEILAENGVTAVNPSLVTILEGQERDALALLMKKDPAFWQNVLELDTSNALEIAASHRQQKRRERALVEFEQHLVETTWAEEEWQEFFEKNEWIFGYGLSYQYMRILESKAEIGGRALTRKGADQVDYLLASQGDVRFTVLVDIKRPDTQLVGRIYRSNTHYPGTHVVGGVAQIQSYLHNWKTDGSQRPQDRPENIGAFTYDPKGILVVGNTSQLDDDHKKKSFELYRRGVNCPDIVTFDELYERARFIVDHGDADVSSTQDLDYDQGVPF